MRSRKYTSVAAVSHLGWPKLLTRCHQPKREQSANLPTVPLYAPQQTREPACRTTAQQLQHGVEGAISNGTRTADLGGSASTSAFTKAVIAAMRNADIAA